jgi:hypothetical protein
MVLLKYHIPQDLDKLIFIEDETNLYYPSEVQPLDKALR